MVVDPEILWVFERCKHVIIQELTDIIDFLFAICKNYEKSSMVQGIGAFYFGYGHP